MAVAPAWKTASEIGDGFTTLNQTTLKKYEKQDLDALVREMDKLQRETRATLVPDNDTKAAQAKNQKLLRLGQANVVLQSYRSRMSK